MNFSEKLLEYMELLECNTNELAKCSGLSYMLINRYINNIRKPKKESQYFNKLVNGIYEIAITKNVKISKEEIYSQLDNSLSSGDFSIDFDLFIENFNTLQKELNISTIEISKAMGYDSSFISRMKNKERKPADFEKFIDKLGNYIVSMCQDEQKRNTLSFILNCPIKDLQDNNNLKKLFTNWICSKHINSRPDTVLNFLNKIDSFDLNDYIGTDFSKVKATTIPFIAKSSKVFFGIEGRKKAEAQFLITTLLSKSEEPIFFYSDLPISGAGNDEEFKKNWVYAMTKLLKRGLHLNMVHNLNRPVNELLLGLENWIPIYMTGSITPYFFKNPPSNFFQCSLCTSGSVALCSECIKYNEKKSKFYLTTKKVEVDFEKEKSKYMLSKATPLMKIYKEENKKDFEKFIKENVNQNIQKIKKDNFKNINFYLNEDNWIIINKETTPEIHFVIYHEKLINAIKTFLLSYNNPRVEPVDFHIGL